MRTIQMTLRASDQPDEVAVTARLVIDERVVFDEQVTPRTWRALVAPITQLGDDAAETIGAVQSAITEAVILGEQEAADLKRRRSEAARAWAEATAAGRSQ